MRECEYRREVGRLGNGSLEGVRLGERLSELKKVLMVSDTFYMKNIIF